MFQCPTCGEMLRVSLVAKLSANFGLSEKALVVIGLSNVDIPKDQAVTFNCPRCRVEVPEALVVGRCAMHGANLMPLKELYTPVKLGGLYCKECLDKFLPGERYVKVTTIISKLVLSN